MRRWVAAGAVAVAVGTIGVVGVGAAEAASAAYFRFKDAAGQSFTFKIDDPARIQQARDILAGKETKKIHVYGRILKQPAANYDNKPWSYRLNQTTVGFFEQPLPFCDAPITVVQQRLAEVGGAFLPGQMWCPGTSQLTAEVKPTAG